LNYNTKVLKSQELSKKFMKSKEYADLSYSAYEQLGKWLDNNKEKIKSDYIDFKPEKKERGAR
ncbi:MAG: hypothetical protein ACI4VQ_03120, partial [Clostridia bacterium]